jgi:hypothetical protein
MRKRFSKYLDKEDISKKWSLNYRDYPQSGRKYLPAIHQTRD